MKNVAVKVEAEDAYDTEQNKLNLKMEIIERLMKTQVQIRRIKTIFLCLMELIGILAIVVSLRPVIVQGNFSEFATYGGTYSTTPHLAYGGDAYTGIQQAAADASNNAKKVGEAVKTHDENTYKNMMSLGDIVCLAAARQMSHMNYILILLGLVIICLSTMMLLIIWKKGIKISHNEVEVQFFYQLNKKTVEATPMKMLKEENIRVDVE